MLGILTREVGGIQADPKVRLGGLRAVGIPTQCRAAAPEDP